jgi:hypothetical protein
MAITDIVMKKIAKELWEWIFLGIRTGMRRAIEEAESLIAQGKTTDAILSIKRAVDLPHRARERINYFIVQYGQQFLIDCLALEGDIMISELNTELTNLENYAANLVARKNGGESWTDITNDIKTNIENESMKWIFPLPPGYLDVWGE